LPRTTEDGDQELSGDNSLIHYISLNVDPERIEEAVLIEDKNQEYQNNYDFLGGCQ